MNAEQHRRGWLFRLQLRSTGLAEGRALYDGHPALGTAGTRVGLGLLGWRSLDRRRLYLFQFGLLYFDLSPYLVHPLAEANQFWLG
jgi:hypothetical protein